MKSDLVVKVKYHRGIEKLKSIAKGDWIDLRAAKDVMMTEGEYKQIPLGVSMQLPKGYEALVIPRSSTFKRLGILCANSIGLIDESYCGDEDEWKFPAYAVRNTVIRKGERIAQFRIIEHQPEITFDEVESLENESRGGFGSTGDF